jgi:hypothetical protein
MNGGKIVNKENTLTSKNGHYYSGNKELTFHYDVVLPIQITKCVEIR